MECILYCSQQGIALCGHDQGRDTLNPENVKSLMILISRHCQEVRDHFKHHSKSTTWLSPSFQNEIIIHFLANEVQEYIKKDP